MSSASSRGAWLALLVVIVAGAAIDYHYLRFPAAAGVAPVAVAAAQSSTGYARTPLARSVGPVGPVPGPARGAQPPTPNPVANDAAVRMAGRRTFLAFNCAGCHGDHAGGGMGPSLRDAAWIYGSDAADIFDSIADGRAKGMPAWGTMLPPEQIWQLVTYLQSLRTADEPEPPQ